MRCHHCCIHMCFFGLHIPQLHSLGQPVPASLMHKRAEPVRHALTQATHVVVLVDPAHGLLQTLFQLARCLLPRPDRPCLLLQSSQPGHRGLVQQEICNVGWLSTRALLRICASPIYFCMSWRHNLSVHTTQGSIPTDQPRVYSVRIYFHGLQLMH